MSYVAAAVAPLAQPLCQVRKYLWISDQETAIATSVDTYRDQGIGAILNVDDTDHSSAGKKAWKDAQLSYRFYKTLEVPTTDIVKRARQIHAHIVHNKALGIGTLVHCHAGKNRRAACILLHLFWEEGGSYDIRLADLRVVRPRAAPMYAFQRQLRREMDVARADDEEAKAAGVEH